MKPILEIKNVSKKFVIHHESKPYLSLRDSFSTLLRKNSRTKEEFFALQDLSFNMERGESLGIIGKNGAGKSTLLKILSRITPPSSGSIKVRGRIASLLEVGTGFHPELSGRENVFFNGSILGMKRKEIERNFDAIVDFAGVGKFIDTPLKHYSSGMQLRLAFAVAAFLENEILIIDEVLAVGDADFQKRCIGKMDEVSKSGRTVLFVSHDLNAISSITNKAILLNNGRIAAEDLTQNVIHQYLQQGKKEFDFIKNDDHSDVPKILAAKLQTTHPGNVQECEKELKLRVTLKIPDKIPATTTWLTVQITDMYGKGIVHESTDNSFNQMAKFPGIQHIECIFPQLRLYQGHYFVHLFLSGPPGGEVYDRVQHICPFQVMILNKQREWEYAPDVCTYFETVNWQVQTPNHTEP